MAAEALLSMRGIDKSFGQVPALVAAGLEVMPGEVMGLIGQNGAGKSTMIKVLNGFCTHDAGTIAFNGQPWGSRVAAGRPAGRREHDLSGDQSRPVPHRHRKYLSRS